MKRVTLLLLAAFFFLSSFQSIHYRSAYFNFVPVNNGTAYVTDWEKNHTWNESATPAGTFTYVKKELAQLGNNALHEGTVVIYAKGYNFSKLSMAAKPVSLPFLFMTPDDTNTVISWQTLHKDGEVHVGFEIDNAANGSVSEFRNNIELRYMYLTQEFMKNNRLTGNALHKMPYSALVKLLKVQP